MQVPMGNGGGELNDRNPMSGTRNPDYNGGMNPRLPLLVLAATILAIAAAALFARKTRVPPRLPMPPALAGEVDRLRVLRRAEPAIPAGGVGHPDYAKRLERV